jgi:triosephosphate isomerase (TIM)
MSRKKIVAGNWKMNMNLGESIDLIKGIISGSGKNDLVEKIVFPSFPLLKSVSDLLHNEADFFVGAQNCSEYIGGAYTGEVSCDMLQSIGCKYVLIGHSERRLYFNESNEQLILKINQALANQLKVIFCVGEKLQERKQVLHFETVKKQLCEVLDYFPKGKISQLVIAYEPVWAIGTGETATPIQTQEMHAFIRSVLINIFSEKAASEISILYGGSCNAQNATELFSCADVDGGLIGGASLKSTDFCKIINSF